MPKKNEPRWGFEPPGFEPGELLTNAKALKLARSAKVPAERLSECADEIRRVGHTFEMTQYIGATETGIAKQRAALEELKHLSRRLAKRLEAVDQTTRTKIVAAYPSNRLPHELDTSLDLRSRTRQPRDDAVEMDRLQLLRRDEKHVGRVAGAVTVALSKLQNDKAAKGGKPNKLMPLKDAAVRFSEIWERYTDKRYTTGAAYKGRSQSATFVVGCLRAISPDATSANISTALKEAATERACEWRKR